MRLTRKLKQQFIDRAKEEIYQLTGIRVADCMVVGNVKYWMVFEPLNQQNMTVYEEGKYSHEHISCCVVGDRYYTDFYSDHLPELLSRPCTDGQKSYPVRAIPSQQYENLKSIATGAIRINAVDEWNDLLDQYNYKKSIKESHVTLQSNLS